MLLRGWFLLAVGGPLLCIGLVLGVVAILQASQTSAYRHARACPADASSHADCLRTVDGTVAVVTGNSEVENAVYEMDVRTGSTTRRLGFSSASPMLDSAQDGDPAVLTLWRGVPVSVDINGRSAATTAVPEKALAGDLTGGAATGGMGLSFVVAALAFGRKDQDRNPLNRPVLGAAILLLLVGGVVVCIGGGLIEGQPSRLDHDFAGTGAALLIVLALCAWFGYLTKQARG